MKKSIILVILALMTYQISAQSTTNMRRLTIGKELEYYVKSNYGNTNKGKTILLKENRHLFDDIQLKYDSFNIIIVPNIDSVCAIFKNNLERKTMELGDFIELDFDMVKMETFFSAYIYVFKSDLTCNEIDPLWKEKREKRKKEGSYSVFSFNHKLTEITYERHR